MIDNAYLERAAADLSQRIGSLIVNSQTVEIKSVSRDGRMVRVVAQRAKGITKITSLKLLDEHGGLITERITNVEISDDQLLEFRFEFEVKGGESI